MGATNFFHKHTRGTTPIFVAGIVFVGVPVLATLNSDLEQLAHSSATFNWYDWIRALVKSAIVGLSALGGFMSTSYKEWRDTKETQNERPRDLDPTTRP